MTRKLAVALLGLGLLNAGNVLALGLGKYTLKSYLNQPLEMEIELLQVRDLVAGEIQTNLASVDDYARAGVDRDFFHTDLKYFDMGQYASTTMTEGILPYEY